MDTSAPEQASTLVELAAAPLFATLNGEALRRLADIAVRMCLPSGQSVFSQGDPADAFYLLIRGEIKVFKLLRDGRSATLRHVRAGETFGESVLFADTYPAYAETTQAAVLYHFPVRAFYLLLLDMPELAIALMARMAHLMVLLNRRVEDLLLPVPARLARYVLELGEQQLDPPASVPAGGLRGVTATPPRHAARICRLPISKRELAARLGTVPETLSRALSALKRARVIRLSGGGELIEILDFDALARIAQI
ncbi:MAG: Crp/Fnr family transcriptional regulator [Actinobacteria bacterium]|nr:Crp/Fnr family transcriptional regulator [Actinomycetota bacterium]